MEQIVYCGKKIKSRSKFIPKGGHRCFHLAGHEGRCHEFPYLVHLNKEAPRIEKKIIRDSTMTTGASWKSEDAGPNRIRRWVMLLSDKQLGKLGVNISKLKPVVVSKLREKAATYEACMDVAKKLTWLAYGVAGCPLPPDPIRQYLEKLFGPIIAGSTTCLVCKGPLDYTDFAKAQRGKALIETSHSNPRLHTPDNVGFAHRDCNIAQGNKTLDEFYTWVADILRRTGRTVT
ncbi:MAG: hypothetical protein L0241_11320 [Planctomycetia bacterium]|nr:hypothetical protein [Planctomycetia bacterium]